MPKFKVEFHRSFRSVERASVWVEASDKIEALHKATAIEETHLLDGAEAFLEWKEDASEFEEGDRDIYVLNEDGYPLYATTKYA